MVRCPDRQLGVLASTSMLMALEAAQEWPAIQPAYTSELLVRRVPALRDPV